MDELQLTPAQLHTVLNRVAFGASMADVQRVQQLGYIGWVERQLTPNDSYDPEYTRRLAYRQLTEISIFAHSHEISTAFLPILFVSECVRTRGKQICIYK